VVVEAATKAEDNILNNGSSSQAKIFNALTNNMQNQGIYLENGQLYLNASYIGSGAIQIGTWSNDAVPVFTETFYANSENGTVRINANSLKIQGTNVVDAAVAQAVPQAALDAEDSILNSVDSHDKIFDALIGGDNQQGIILDNGKLYLSANYIRTGTLKVGGTGAATDGSISIRDSSNKEFGSITYEGINIKKQSAYGATTYYGMKMNELGMNFYRGSSDFGHLNVIEYGSGSSQYSHCGVTLSSPETHILAQDGRTLYLGFYDWNGLEIDGLVMTVNQATFGEKVVAPELHADNGYSGTINGMRFVDGILVSAS
jgi:hypothetical protein